MDTFTTIIVITILVGIITRLYNIQHILKDLILTIKLIVAEMEKEKND